MNRQTLLAAIHRQLRESLAETGEVRPLGEIVGLVAKEIRSSQNGQVATGVLPIETVAAFVDGELSGEESEAVCQAVMVDNSVLAELVSAVRSIQQPAEEFDPLPEVLRNQLLAMQASLPARAESPDSVDDLPIAEEPAPAIQAEPVVRRLAKHKRRNLLKPMIAILSVAATLAAIIFLATRNDNQDPDQPKIVQDKPIDPSPPDPIAPESAGDSDIRIVDSTNEPSSQPEPVLPNMQPIPDSEPPAMVAQQDPQERPNTPKPSIDSLVPGSTPDSSPIPAPEPSNLVRAPELSGLRWTKVTGILTRRNVVASTSASRTAMWESVQAGAGAPVENAEGPIMLRTLPLSRAEATFQSGGRVVLAADSGMAVSKGDATTSAEINFHHGDVALLDLPDGTMIRLIKAGHPLAVLRWQSKASVLLQHAADGLEVHVRGGTIDVNRQPQKDSSITIASNRAIQSIQQPKRLPIWVDRPVSTINVKQTFLAQIGESRNVMGTLNQQIRGLTENPRATDVDARTLATLATWQAALAGERVFRLAGSPVPAVRMAALNRIIGLPRWDPRYVRTWTAIENVSRDKQRVQRFKRFAFLAQQNGAPSAAQINMLLDDLASPDIASRAMSDFLLRRFHRNAARRLPTFDPTWTGQSQTRAANGWRTYLGRTAAPAQRQPAAAANRVRQ